MLEKSFLFSESSAGVGKSLSLQQAFLKFREKRQVRVLSLLIIVFNESLIILIREKVS